MSDARQCGMVSANSFPSIAHNGWNDLAEMAQKFFRPRFRVRPTTCSRKFRSRASSAPRLQATPIRESSATTVVPTEIKAQIPLALIYR
jgi:hypothetical protein